MSERVIPASMQSHYDGFHFAPAVKDGGRLYCSGQLGVGPGDVVLADPGEQFVQAFENLATLLAEAGVAMADLIEMTTYHVDLAEHLPVFMQAKDRFVAEPYPAWTAIGVSALAFPGALVEIRAIARLAE